MSYTNYADVLMQQNVYSFLLAILIICLFVIGICAIFTIRKSKQYRKEIIDMYVASKTKQLAKDEGLDLVLEYESFKKWLKKKKLECTHAELDEVIEAELMEKVQEPKAKK